MGYAAPAGRRHLFCRGGDDVRERRAAAAAGVVRLRVRHRVCAGAVRGGAGRGGAGSVRRRVLGAGGGAAGRRHGCLDGTRGAGRRNSAAAAAAGLHGLPRLSGGGRRCAPAARSGRRGSCAGDGHGATGGAWRQEGRRHRRSLGAPRCAAAAAPGPDAMGGRLAGAYPVTRQPGVSWSVSRQPRVRWHCLCCGCPRCPRWLFLRAPCVCCSNPSGLFCLLCRHCRPGLSRSSCCLCCCRSFGLPFRSWLLSFGIPRPCLRGSCSCGRSPCLIWRRQPFWRPRA